MDTKEFLLLGIVGKHGAAGEENKSKNPIF